MASGFLIAPLVTSALTAIGVGAAAAIITPFITTGIMIGLSLLMRPGRPKMADAPVPKPSNGSLAFMQAIPPRMYGVGTARVAGAVLHAAEKKGRLHTVLALIDQEIGPVERWYLHDDWVELGAPNGPKFVINGIAGDSRYYNLVTLEVAYGVTGVMPFSDLYDAFPDDVGPNFYGTGISMLYMQCYGVGNFENHVSAYPHNKPAPSVVAPLAKVWDPRDEAQDPDDPATWDYSSNVVLCWLWYECFCDHGPRRPVADAILPYIAVWQQQADICDEEMETKAGGTVPRYQIGYWWTAETQRETVRAMFITACDGWMCELPDGGLIVRVGKYVDSGVILTDDDIVGFFLQTDVAKEDRINELVVKYTSTYQFHNYGEVEADPIIDNDALIADGEPLSHTVDLWQVQELNQAKRLAYREWQRQNEKVRGSITTTLSGLQALGERWVTIQSARIPRMADTVVEIRAVSSQAVDGLMHYEWVRSGAFMDEYDPDDPVFGDGEPPPVKAKPQVSTLPVPVVISVAAVGDAIAGVQAKVIIEDPASPDVAGYVIRWQFHSGASTWSQLIVSDPEVIDGEITLYTGLLQQNNTYDVQVATVGSRGSFSEWSTLVTISTSLDPDPPGTPSNMSAVYDAGGLGGPGVDVAWRNPNSANMYAARVYRGAVFATADAISGQLYGTANQDMTFFDDDPDLGATNTYWVTAENPIGATSAPASGSVVVP